MPGLTIQPSAGDWLYVYNDENLFPGLPEGAMVWRGQVLECVVDTGDPQTSRYRICGPRDSEPSVVPGKSLEWVANARFLVQLPSALGTGDTRVTASSLREGLNAAVARVAAVRDTGDMLAATAVGAIRALLPGWELAVAKGLLTVAAMERDVNALRELLATAAAGLVSKLVKNPKN
jgi:hypothetical protein